MPKGQKRQNINFRETKLERSATGSFTNFRKQFIKMGKKLKTIGIKP